MPFLLIPQLHENAPEASFLYPVAKQVAITPWIAIFCLS